MENKGKRDNGKTAAYVLGGAVYAGVVIVFTTMTINFIVGILAEDAYLMRGLLTAGVVMVGLNSVALPVALHFWAVDGWHRGVAIALYALDMVVLAFNGITSFSTLSGNPPAWVMSYEPYSVGMFVFALATWGILWMTDPGEQARVEMAKATQAFNVKAIRKAAEYLDTIEGQEAIAREAANLLPQILESKAKGQPVSWSAPARTEHRYPADVEAVNPKPPVSNK